MGNGIRIIGAGDAVGVEKENYGQSGGISQLSLEGNIGKSVTLQGPAGTILTEEVIRCNILGGDAHSRNMVVTAFLDPAVSTPGLKSASLSIEFGSDGVQGASSLFDIMKGVSLSVPGSYLKATITAEVDAVGPANVRIGVFASLTAFPRQDRLLATNPINLAAGISTTQVLFPFTQAVNVVVADNRADDVFLEILDQLGVVIWGYRYPPGSFPTWLPINNSSGSAQTIRITNLGVVALSATLLQGIEL